MGFSNYNGNCVMVGAMDNRAGAVKPDPHSALPLSLTIGGCNAGDTTIEWSVDSSHNTLRVNDSLCVGVVDETHDAKLSPLMLWKKRLPADQTAILIMNNFYKRALASVEVDLSWLGQEELLAGSVALRDVWNHQDKTAISGGKLMLSSPLESFDSAFLVLTPESV